MKSAPRMSGRLEHRATSERRVTPTDSDLRSGLTETQRRDKINELFKAMGAAREKYFENVTRLRKTTSTGEEYTEAYQEWATKMQAASRERDDEKRAQLTKESQEALALAKELQKQMDNHAEFQADAERTMKEEVEQAELAILALGGVLDLTAPKQEAGDE